MKLTGLVVKTEQDAYTSKTGQAVALYKFILAAGDPAEAGTEVSCTEDDFNKIAKGDEVTFVPSFVVRNRYGNLISAVRVVEGLEVKKGAK